MRDRGPLRKGLEAGALFIDTAESYGTEIVVGEALRGLRDRAFVATKVSPQNFNAPDLHRSVDASLQRLGIDEIDLLQLHEPNAHVAIGETMGAMADLVAVGKIKFIGVSNFSVVQLIEAQQAAGKYPIVSNQVRYSIHSGPPGPSCPAPISWRLPSPTCPPCGRPRPPATRTASACCAPCSAT